MVKVVTVFEEEGIRPVSKVTLAWIKGAPEKWKQFVRNRVASIQDAIPASAWKYVATAENPADLVSRGCDFQTLIQWCL